MSLTDDLDQTIAGIRLALQSVNGPRNGAPVSGTIKEKEQKGVATGNVPPFVWADKKSISPALTPSSSELTPANGFREGQDELALEIERLQQERRQLEREIEKTDRRFIKKNSESQENTAQNVERSLLPDAMQSLPKLEGWEENLSKFSKEYEEHFTSENESPPKVSSNKLQIQRSAGPTIVRAAAPSKHATPAVVSAAGPVEAWVQVVEMNLRLDMDFQAAGQEGSIQRQIFIKDLKQDLANATGMGASDFNILKVSAGSVLVDMQAPEKAAQDIQRQSLDPNSRLRSGIVTRFTDKITLPRANQHLGIVRTEYTDEDLAGEGERLALEIQRRMATHDLIRDTTITEEYFSSKNENSNKLQIQRSAGATIVRTAAPSQPTLLTRPGRPTPPMQHQSTPQLQPAALQNDTWSEEEKAMHRAEVISSYLPPPPSYERVWEGGAQKEATKTSAPIAPKAPVLLQKVPVLLKTKPISNTRASQAQIQEAKSPDGSPKLGLLMDPPHKADKVIKVVYSDYGEVFSMDDFTPQKQPPQSRSTPEQVHVPKTTSKELTSFAPTTCWSLFYVLLIDNFPIMGMSEHEEEPAQKSSELNLQIQRSAGPTVVRAATAAPSQPAVPAAVRAAAPVQAGSTHANQHLGIVRTEYTDEDLAGEGERLALEIQRRMEEAAQQKRNAVVAPAVSDWQISPQVVPPEISPHNHNAFSVQPLNMPESYHSGPIRRSRYPPPLETVDEAGEDDAEEKEMQEELIEKYLCYDSPDSSPRPVSKSVYDSSVIQPAPEELPKSPAPTLQPPPPPSNQAASPNSPPAPALLKSMQMDTSAHKAQEPPPVQQPRFDEPEPEPVGMPKKTTAKVQRSAAPGRKELFQEAPIQASVMEAEKKNSVPAAQPLTPRPLTPSNQAAPPKSPQEVNVKPSQLRGTFESLPALKSMQMDTSASKAPPPPPRPLTPPSNLADSPNSPQEGNVKPSQLRGSFGSLPTLKSMQMDPPLQRESLSTSERGSEMHMPIQKNSGVPRVQRAAAHRPTVVDDLQDERVEHQADSAAQVVEMNLRLDMDFQAAGQEGSIQRQIFIEELKQDLADSSGMGNSDFNILKVSPGSVLVDMQAPEKAAQEIQRQSLDSKSRLRSGKITRFTDKITLARVMQQEEMLGLPSQLFPSGPASRKASALAAAAEAAKAAAEASMTAAAANQISIENQLLLEQQHQLQDNLRAEKQYEWRISAAPTKPEAAEVLKFNGSSVGGDATCEAAEPLPQTYCGDPPQLTLDCCSLPRSNAAAPQSPYSPVKSSGGQSPFLQPVTMSDFGYAMLLAEANQVVVETDSDDEVSTSPISGRTPPPEISSPMTRSPAANSSPNQRTWPALSPLPLNDKREVLQQGPHGLFFSAPQVQSKTSPTFGFSNANVSDVNGDQEAGAPLSPTMLDEEITDDFFLRTIESTTGARHGASVLHYSESGAVAQKARTKVKAYDSPAYTVLETDVPLRKSNSILPDVITQVFGWEEKEAAQQPTIAPSIYRSSNGDVHF